ncbi:hypothetical protein PR003_g31052 [Phytophthora rubi]|nr:hypothetical protein PR003_g31052 [Phytophthora rubi]
MARGRVCAERARDKEQARQARYYDQNVRRRHVFKAGDRVWMYNPPRGPKATKFVHQWMGPMRIIEPVGYENFVLKREDKNGRAELIVAHVSFLVNYQPPVSLLPRIADDLAAQLEHEDSSTSTTDSSDKKAKSEYNYNDGVPVLSWWSCEDESIGTEPANTCLNTSCNPQETDGPVRWTADDGPPSLGGGRPDGSALPSTIAGTTPAGSWKTPAVRKSCNEGLLLKLAAAAMDRGGRRSEERSWAIATAGTAARGTPVRRSQSNVRLACTGGARQPGCTTVRLSEAEHTIESADQSRSGGYRVPPRASGSPRRTECS